ncbi:MAG: hypothetical protein DWQ04_18605 [Chloroflexi bacterium]|nr:MAG: hypothetical protein DWQ04_18605 [Chloroflexota bacterium]
MSINWVVGVFAMTVFAGLIYTASRWRVRKTPSCPKCNDKHVVEIGRDILKSDHVTIPEAFGYQVRMQQTFQLTYRCNACDHTFSRQMIETDL